MTLVPKKRAGVGSQCMAAAGQGVQQVTERVLSPALRVGRAGAGSRSFTMPDGNLGRDWEGRRRGGEAVQGTWGSCQVITLPAGPVHRGHLRPRRKACLRVPSTARAKRPLNRQRSQEERKQRSQ